MASHASRRSSDGEYETEPLSPSAIDYPFLFGRRYHNMPGDAYLYPNDEHEQRRQDCEFGILQKYVFEEELYFAPLEHPQNILDIGTGTGIWAIDMANRFPQCRVKGWDLSAIQPPLIPPNLDCELYDCTRLDWFRRPGSMDYIHVSMLFGALPIYEDMIRKAKEHLVPGTGWLECQELLPTVFSDDDTIPRNWAFNLWLDRFKLASSRHLRPPRPVMIADKIKHYMERAGYVDIHEFCRAVPIGDWPAKTKMRNLGKLWRANLDEALQGWSYKPLGPEGLQMTRNEIEVLLATARADLRNPNVHGYQKIYVVYGRRPTQAEAKALKDKGLKGAQIRNSVHPAVGAKFPASQHSNATPNPLPSRQR